jgi:hypothetical protein
MSESVARNENEYDVFNTTTPEEMAEEVRRRKEQAGNFVEYFNIEKNIIAVARFLDDAPLTFFQHRIWDKSLKQGVGGWRNLTCIRENCPLCAIQTDKEKARFVGAYRLVHLDNVIDGKVVPKVKIFLKGINTIEILERKNRRKAISSEDMEIERIGDGFDTKYLFEFTGKCTSINEIVATQDINLKEVFKVQLDILNRLAIENGGKGIKNNTVQSSVSENSNIRTMDDIPF